MGTLFSQPERKQHSLTTEELDGFLADAVLLAKKHKIPVTDVVHARHALELRRQNDLFVQNGDIFDEQAAGFGELMQRLCTAVEQLAAIEHG